MKVIHHDQAERIEPQPGWSRASLCCEDGVSVEYFSKPSHHASPMHHHTNAQVCIVLQGAMIVRLEDGREERMEAGSACYFPPDERHQVVNALDVPSLGIEVFVPGRSFDFWTKRLAAGDQDVSDLSDGSG